MWVWKLARVFFFGYQCAFCQWDLQGRAGRSRVRAVTHTSRFLVQVQHPNVNREGEKLPWHGMPTCGPVWGVVCWHDRGHIRRHYSMRARDTRNTKRTQAVDGAYRSNHSTYTRDACGGLETSFFHSY